MSVVRGFADLHEADEVRLVSVGADKPLVVAGHVHAVTRFALHLDLPPGAGPVEGMTPGCEVGVHRPDGRVGYARVESLDDGGLGRMLLTPLFASSTPTERRASPRAMMQNMRGQAVQRHEHGATCFPIEVVNLSASGLQLVAPRSLRLSDEIVIMLPLLRKLGVTYPTGRVAWIRKEGTGTRAGLEFVRLSEMERNAIGYFVFKQQFDEAA